MKSLVDAPGAEQVGVRPRAGRSWAARLDTPWLVALVAVLAYTSFLGAFLYHGAKTPLMRRREAIRRFDYSRAVQAGDAYSDPAHVPPHLSVRKGDGFDGQFFYRLSLNPFTAQRTQYGITIDAPAYRQERIVYPLLAWAASLGGDPRLVPKALLLVNLVALGVIGWMGGALACTAGRHALWGLMVALGPGFLWTLRVDTCEIVDMAFLTSALWCLRGRRPAAATALLTLACLTRETSLAFAGAAALAWLWERRLPVQSRLTRWYLPAVPLATLGAWQLFLKHRWGMLPAQGGGHNFGLPFGGIMGMFAANSPPGDAGRLVELIAGACFLGLAVAVLMALRSSVAPLTEKVAWGVFATLALLLNDLVWSEDENFLRTSAGFYVLGALIVIGAKSGELRRATFAGVTLLWLLMTMRVVVFS